MDVLTVESALLILLISAGLRVRMGMKYGVSVPAMAAVTLVLS